MTADWVAYLARITGRVQMVWFRAWTVEEAKKRGLSGWVRNRKDGSVEALFYGPPEMVEDMLGACAVGPPEAEVIEIVKEPALAPKTDDFLQLPTE
ncbi:MAG: acylphosphatase [Rhodospirillales bacterium]|nr:acylphosphatase [Rhodospirillales bacterium]